MFIDDIQNKPIYEGKDFFFLFLFCKLICLSGELVMTCHIKERHSGLTSIWILGLEILSTTPTLHEQTWSLGCLQLQPSVPMAAFLLISLLESFTRVVPVPNSDSSATPKYINSTNTAFPIADPAIGQGSMGPNDKTRGGHLPILMYQNIIKA